MKVTIEGITEEMLEVAELIAYGKAYKAELKSREDLSAKVVRNLNARDDIPDSLREEGV